MATRSAQGVTFSWSDDDGSTYYPLGQLVDLTVPSVSKDTIETTSYGSNGFREFTGGIIDNGEVTAVVNYDVHDTGKNSDGSTVNQVELRKLAATSFETTTNKKFKIAFPDPDGGSSLTEETMIFTGVVAGFEMATPVDDIIKATFSIKVSGAITYSDS